MLPPLRDLGLTVGVEVSVEIPDDLHRAKAAAALQGITLKEFLIAALEKAVAKDAPDTRKRR
jgi:hypothetical protein